MNRSREFSYEQAVSAVIIILISALAWLPYMFSAAQQPYFVRAFLPINAAICLVTLGFVYDIAERIFSRGKGIYAAVIFCTLPAVCVAATAAALALNAMTAVVAFSIWLGARAEGDKTAWLFVILPFILIYGGMICGANATALSFVPAIVFAVKDRENPWTKSAVLAGALLVGVALRWAGLADWLPEFRLPTLALSRGEAALMLLPWCAWAIPALRDWKRDPRIVATAIAMLLAMAISANDPRPLAAAVVMLSPAIALMAADYFVRAFTERGERKIPASFWTYLIVAASLAGAIANFVSSQNSVTVVPIALLGGILVIAIIATYLLDLPRWSYALMVTAALWIGMVLRTKSTAESVPSAFHVSPLPLVALFFALSIAAAIAWRRLYGVPVPRSALQPGADFKYAGLELRDYTPTGWAGEPADVLANSEAAFSFVIFGDVAGADSVVTGRQNGYLVYRKLAQTINEARPAFAISLGDISMKASELAYRRARQLLRKIHVPLIVTPGNHDLFDEAKYDARLFHSLYGADNRSFQVGNVHFVILNNAWGSVTDEQFAWLEAELHANNAPIRLVFCHKPVFDPREDAFYAMEHREHADKLHRLFVQHGIHAVFSGHIHTLMSFERDGVHYVISGGGGSKLATADAVYHYWHAEAASQSLTLTALPILDDKDRTALTTITLNAQT